MAGKWLDEIYTNVVVTPQGTYFIAPLEDPPPSSEQPSITTDVDLGGEHGKPSEPR